MSSDNLTGKPGTKDEINQSSGSRKTTPSSAGRPQEQQALKCPRCDSPNTKFCYYNNYSLTQPRHFCKTCRRYWTKGGALRNVPIGGGCRKNKKIIKSSSSSSRLTVDSKDSGAASSSDIIGGLKFFHGLSPAMDFQLTSTTTFPPRLHSATAYGQLFSKYGGDISNTPDAIPSGSCFGLDPSSASAAGSSGVPLLGGFNFPFSSVEKQGESGGFNDQMMGNSVNVHSSLASSIESLSSINQDLHWKLQQQRLSMLFGGSGGGENNHKETQQQQQQVARRPQPILFHNLEISSKPAADSCPVVGNYTGKDSSAATAGGGNNLATEWFFDNNSYPPPVNPTPTTSGSGGNDSSSNWNNGNNIQAWSNMNQYSSLP